MGPKPHMPAPIHRGRPQSGTCKLFHFILKERLKDALPLTEVTVLTVQELFRKTSWSEVEEALLRFYSAEAKCCLSGFKRVFKIISRCKPSRNPQMMRVQIDWTGEYWDVYGRQPESHHEFGLCFSRFSQWAGFNFRKSDLYKMTAAEAVAHILWEASYHGFSDHDITRKRRRILEAASAR